MKRYLLIGFISILTISCQDKKTKYNPESIELNNQACELMKNLDYDSALILLDKATFIDRNYHIAYGNKIVIYCQRKEYKKAMLEAENQLKAKPDLVEGWTFAGMLYDKQEDTIKAKEYYLKSIELYEKRILLTQDKELLISNKLNRAISLVLLGNEKAGKEEMEKLKSENLENLRIDKFLEMNKQEYLKSIFNDN